MPTVLLSAPYMIPIVERFNHIFEESGVDLIIPSVDERLNEEQLLSYAGSFDGTICGDDQYSKRVLEACIPRLKVISKWGTGIDSIDKDAAKEFGVQVMNTENAFTLPVADTVLGYILAFARQHPWQDNDMKTGGWNKMQGHSLSECTLGVIGVGKIGRAVLRRARVFGMELLGNDVVEILPDFVAENLIEMVSLDDLLMRSNFVSINCDLNPTSYKLLNSDRFQQMKPDAVLINTARGPIIDELSMINALRSKRIAGAALDVYEEEPLLLDHPLREMKNVLLAPHNANSSPAAWERVHKNTIKNLLIGLGISFDPSIISVGVQS